MDNHRSHSPVRVLHISLRADFTGGPIYMLKLIKGLGADVRCFVACPLDKPLTGAFEEAVGAESLCGVPERAFTLGALTRLVRFVRDNRIDVVHSHGKGAGAYARLISLLARTPSIHTFHGLHFRHYSWIGRKLYAAYERLMSRLSDALVTVVDSEKDVAVAQGFAPARKIVVIRTGIDEVPPMLHWPEGGPVNALHATRFDAQKNFAPLIALAASAKERGLEGRLRFTVIGNGPDGDHYRAIVGQRALEGFFDFRGVVPNQLVPFDECKVLISTSLWEGLPIAPLESAEMGLFLLLSRIPGHVELVLDETGGLLFDPDDTAQFDAVLDALLALEHRTTGSAQHAERLTERFSYADMIARHRALYTHIARNEPGDPATLSSPPLSLSTSDR